MLKTSRGFTLTNFEILLWSVVSDHLLKLQCTKYLQWKTVSSKFQAKQHPLSSSYPENACWNTFSQILKHKYNYNHNSVLKVSLDSVRKKSQMCICVNSLCLARENITEMPWQMCDPLFWMQYVHFPTDLLKLINVWLTLRSAHTHKNGAYTQKEKKRDPYMLPKCLSLLILSDFYGWGEEGQNKWNALKVPRGNKRKCLGLKQSSSSRWY